MCKHIISYRVRSDSAISSPMIVMLDTDADLERQLSSLRASPELTSLTVFTATTKLERVPSWVERQIVDDPIVVETPQCDGPEIIGTPGLIVPPRLHSTDA